jgi:hypothetical protein
MRAVQIVVMSALLASAPALSQAEAFSPADRSEGEAKIQFGARRLATTVRDPSSASFRNVFIQKRVNKYGIHITVCGEMNARNGYGGLAGFQPFIITGDKVYVGTALGSIGVGEMCRNNNPAVDTRDYTKEMKAAYLIALSS